MTRSLAGDGGAASPTGCSQGPAQVTQALGVCSTFNGKYCHCQVELGNGQQEGFFISILRASVGLGKEPGVPVLHEMPKIHLEDTAWVLGLFLVCRELEGKLTLRKPCSSWLFGFISEAWPHVRAHSLTSLHSPENDGIYSSSKLL